MKDQNKKNSQKQTKKEQAKREKKRVDEVKKKRREEEDKIHLFSKGKYFDFGLLLVVIILLTVGLIMILSASSAYSLRTEGDSYFYFKKQLMFAGIGLVAMLIVSEFDYRILNSRLSWLAYVRWFADLWH